MPNDSTPCNIEDITSAFVEAPKYILQTIANKIRKAKTLYTAMVPRGTFELGHGYTAYKEEFHGGLAIQDGGTSWKVMAKYRKPGTGTATIAAKDDPGYDPCKSEALEIGRGTEEKNWTVFQTERRTEDICLTDARFFWQLEQQLALWYESLAQVSIAEWEQILGAAYASFCTKAVVRQSTLDSATGLDTFTLTPDAGGTFGGSITIPAGGLGTIGVLNTSVLDRLYQYLVRQVNDDGYLGMDSGMPLFGLAASQETIGDLIKQDSKEVTALYWAQPGINIEGYGVMRTYKNWVHYNDWNAERYAVNAAGTALVRVFPYKATPTTIGDAIVVDPAYLNAPFEVSKVIIRNVFTADVPPPNPSAISGFQFSPFDNIMDWTFMNIKDRCDNPRGEKGFFLARGRMAPEPMQNSAYVIEILHRRCNYMIIEECTTCTNTDATPNMVTVAQLDTTEVKAASKNWIIQLDGCLNCQVGDRVTVTVVGSGSGTKYGTLVDNMAGTYIVVCLDTAQDLSISTVASNTVACGGTNRA